MPGAAIEGLIERRQQQSDFGIGFHGIAGQTGDSQRVSGQMRRKPEAVPSLQSQVMFMGRRKIRSVMSSLAG